LELMMVRFGVTEKVWNSTYTEKKLLWKFFLLVVSFLCAPFICRSNDPIINWTVAAIAILSSQMVIETQRHFTEIKNLKFRKRLLLSQVAVGIYAIIGLGIILFGGIFYYFAKGVFPPFIEMAEVGMFGLPMTIIITFLAITLGVAIFRVTTDLPLKEILFYLPRSGLKSLLVQRRFIAGSFIELIAFEAGVHFVIFYYLGSLSHLVRTLYLGTFI
jgi:hypothetical protein